ncbi:MAG TPA: hypothetical protein VK148_26090 [Xanthobacteraceae bacterium]|jgi:hypothetical protein|nr:hypothetical protein [Xanthobacteraceae bacterium]
MTTVPATSDFVRDAIFISNSPLPDVIASIRLVALIPARTIGLRVLYFGARMDAKGFLDKHRPSAIILTKAGEDGIVELARAAAARHIPVATTLCDHHFAGEIGRRNRQLCDLSKAIVVQTQPMAHEIFRHYGKSCAIIEEAVEYPRGQAQFTPGRPLKGLWYGHQANHPTLAPGIAALGAAGLGPTKFIVVSNAVPDFMRGGFPGRPKDFDFDVVPWTIEAQYSTMAWCDFVFVPSSDTPDKRVKGHNRVVEAINAGRLAITFPLPQYRELADYTFCHADYGASIRAALADPQAAQMRIENGQRYVDGRFAADIIAAKWRELISGLSR